MFFLPTVAVLFILCTNYFFNRSRLLWMNA